jgi:hypothetical protein
MNIKVVDVKVRKQILTCSDTTCSGNYEFTGEINVLASEDPTAPGVHTFTHKCSVCQDSQNFDQKFPSLIYEEM